MKWFRWWWWNPLPTPPDPGDTLPGNPEQKADQLTLEINRYRARHGKRPLISNDCLAEQAQTHSLKMELSEKLFHGPNWTDRLRACGFVAGAENVAMNRTAKAVVDAWAKSPAHNRNMLGDYTEIGSGVAGRYWCSIFAAKWQL